MVLQERFVPKHVMMRLEIVNVHQMGWQKKIDQDEEEM